LEKVEQIRKRIARRKVRILNLVVAEFTTVGSCIWF